MKSAADVQVFEALRDVGEVQSGRWGEDVGVIFGARFLEAVQRGVAVVFGQALVLMAFTGKLNVRVFGQCDAERLPIKLLTIQVAHGYKHKHSTILTHQILHELL